MQQFKDRILYDGDRIVLIVIGLSNKDVHRSVIDLRSYFHNIITSSDVDGQKAKLVSLGYAEYSDTSIVGIRLTQMGEIEYNNSLQENSFRRMPDRRLISSFHALVKEICSRVLSSKFREKFANSKVVQSFNRLHDAVSETVEAE